MDLSRPSNVSAFQYVVQVGHNFSSKEQVSFNFTAAVTICSDVVKEELKCDDEGTGKGNGDPLQYSCLENPMDGGAW